MSVDSIARGLAALALSVPPSKNPSQLYSFRAALARQRGGGDVAKIACFGDSTTEGQGGSVTQNLTFVNSYPFQLAKLLSANGIPASNSCAVSNNITDDSRLSMTGFLLIWYSFDGAIYYTPASTVCLFSFVPGVSTDSVDIYWYDRVGTSGAVFTVEVDGGATLATVTAAGTNVVRKTTVTYAAGLHTINIHVASQANSVWLVSFDAYLSTLQPQVRVLNCGVGGSTSSAIPTVWYPSTNGLSALTAMTTIPDLYIVDYGINDAHTGVPVPTYVANLTAGINFLKTQGDVILMTHFPSGAAVTLPSIQAPYVAAAKALAISLGIICIDENANLVSNVAMGTYGLDFGDHEHLSSKGYSVVAQDVCSAILANL